MTRAEHLPELPELPEGKDWVARAAALLIMVVGFFGATAVYLETKASDRESTADRWAKVNVLESTKHATEASSASSVSNFARRLRSEARVQRSIWRRGVRTDHTGHARAEAIAWTAVAGVIGRDAQLKRAIRSRKLDEAAEINTQTANAYERERDARTSQARRLVTVITDFAVALFLLGLVATVPLRARIPFLVFASLLALSACAWAGHIASGQVETPNVQAIAAYARGKVAALAGGTPIPAYSRAIELKGDYYDARLARGREYLELGMYGRAVTDLRRATQLDPSDFAAWNGLAEAQWWEHEYHDALGSINRAATLNPTDPTTAFNRAEVLIVAHDSAGYSEQLGHLRHALRPFRKVVGETGSPDALERLCSYTNAARLTGQYDPSIKAEMETLGHDLRTRVGESLGLIPSRNKCARLRQA